MADPRTTLPTESGPEAAPQRPVERKGLRWLEVCLVVFFAFGTSFYNSLYLLKHGPSAQTLPTGTRGLFGTLHEVMALALVGYILARSGRRFRDIGLLWSIRDIGVGIVLLVVSVAATIAGILPLYLLHVHIYGTPPVFRAARQFFGHFSITLLPYFLIGPAFEELIVRAYLMTEIRELTGSAVLAVAASYGLQASYHLYYGWWGALLVSFQFLVYAIYYARWRRALPIIVAHELFDLQALFRL